MLKATCRSMTPKATPFSTLIYTTQPELLPIQRLTGEVRPPAAPSSILPSTIQVRRLTSPQIRMRTLLVRPLAAPSSSLPRAMKVISSALVSKNSTACVAGQGSGLDRQGARQYVFFRLCRRCCAARSSAGGLSWRAQCVCRVQTARASAHCLLPAKHRSTASREHPRGPRSRAAAAPHLVVRAVRGAAVDDGEHRVPVRRHGAHRNQHVPESRRTALEMSMDEQCTLDHRCSNCQATW